jgi:GNAT superfamily N-acetyltransferase
MSERLNLERTPGNPSELPESDLESLAKLYALVFAGKPWNEYTVCPANGTFFGTDTKPDDTCPEADCGATLQPAYPLEQTKDYITGELARSDAALLLLRDEERDGELVGFSWGFSYDSPEALAAAKYKTPAMQVAIGGLLRRLELGANGLWYLSESGIENDPRYRGKGISREFHAKRLEIARSLGLDAIQRTSAYGNMYRTSKRTMTQIMGTETAPDAISGELQPTGTIANGLEDSELAGRVLFAQSNQ